MDGIPLRNHGSEGVVSCGKSKSTVKSNLRHRSAFEYLIELFFFLESWPFTGADVQYFIFVCDGGIWRWDGHPSGSGTLLSEVPAWQVMEKNETCGLFSQGQRAGTSENYDNLNNHSVIFSLKWNSPLNFQKTVISAVLGVLFLRGKSLLISFPACQKDLSRIQHNSTSP